MGVLLEIKAGPFAGKKIAVVTGQTVSFGRAGGRAEFSLPHDTFMSGVHFAVECGASGCRVQDRKSSNGTFLNGAKIQDAMLANGDEIKGGQTIFAVKIVADAKLASLVQPQDVAPPAPSLQASPGGGQLSVPDQRPRLAEPSVSSAEPARPEVSAPVFSAPRPPVETPKPLHGGRAAPGEGENPPGAGVNSPRASAPPPGVASHIARKFGDGPLERGDGSLRGAAFSVMGWSFPAAPAEWQVQEGFGLQQSGHEEFPNSVAASEELLGGITLQQFVESQISMLRGYLRDPKFEPSMPPRVGRRRGEHGRRRAPFDQGRQRTNLPSDLCAQRIFGWGFDGDDARR